MLQQQFGYFYHVHLLAHHRSTRVLQLSCTSLCTDGSGAMTDANNLTNTYLCDAIFVNICSEVVNRPD